MESRLVGVCWLGGIFCVLEGPIVLLQPLLQHPAQKRNLGFKLHAVPPGFFGGSGGLDAGHNEIRSQGQGISQVKAPHDAAQDSGRVKVAGAVVALGTAAGKIGEAISVAVQIGHPQLVRGKAHAGEHRRVDSEHSAIFQCLNGENRVQLKKILLTASGGPFRGKKKEELKNVQVEDALKHPNWHMGRKITIDSATLVNKGLEMMEARWLFGVEPDNIQIVVQPKSIIHSMVEFVDGAVIAQLGTPDMKLPIQYALYYPERRYLPGDRLDFWTLGQITFEKPDMENFPGLRLAFDAAAAGGSLPTVYNAANERAVAMFLEKKIGFLEIPEIIQSCMEAHRVIPDPTVEQILETEEETYEMIKGRW